MEALFNVEPSRLAFLLHNRSGYKCSVSQEILQCRIIYAPDNTNGMTTRTTARAESISHISFLIGILSDMGEGDILISVTP